ncbi:MAG: DegT/DnrJ/EryC1/StrS family aminotransferase, partial [Bacteroidota bacterium]
GKGDEVLVPAISWIATSEAVSSVGATTVFVDLDEYYTLDPKAIEAKITPKTKVIIPVHLYGQPADMPAIMAIAKAHNLLVLEDCAQAHGATIEGKKVGTWGNAASFSFYPGKNLGAYGDAGAMLTNDAEVAEKVRRISNHGQLKKHDHLIEGRNSRMDTLQAAVLSVKLPYLDEWSKLRVKHANSYNQLMQGSHIKKPQVRANATHVYHLYVVRIPQRESVKKQLTAQGIQTSIHYPTALPFLPCYASMKHQPADFPSAYKFQQEILSLPIFPELTDEQIQFVSEAFIKINTHEDSSQKIN